MKELLIRASEHAIVAIDAMALVVVLYGTLEAFVRAARAVVAPIDGREQREI